MRSSKAAPGTPLKYTRQQIQAAIKRGSWCEPCQRDLHNVGGMKSHNQHRHSPASEPAKAGAPELRPPVGQAPVSTVVTFYSRKAPQMRIVFDPSRKRSNGMGEQELTEGIEIQFEGGVYRTDDDKIIAFLEGDVAAAIRLGMKSRNGKPRVYSDPRYPIVSDRQLNDARKMQEVHAANAPKPEVRPRRGDEFVPSPVVAEGFKGGLL